jgi:hypothetical protein
MELKRIVEMANLNESLMDGTTGPVMEIMAAADVVWAVWQDFEAPNSVSTLLLKGASALVAIASSGQARELRCTAVKVIDAEMAVAARMTLGGV